MANDVIAVIQARMSSERLPGKVLREVRGKPILTYVIERLQHCSFDPTIILATSVDPSDDPVEAFAASMSVPYHRGPLEDVAGRMQEVVEKYDPEIFFRVNADSPFVDPGSLAKGLQISREGNYDLVTTIFPRTFPPGASVEVVRADAFRRAYAQMESDQDREHVTRYFYQHPDDFRIHNMTLPSDHSDIHLAIDTADDVVIFEQILERMEKPHWEYTLDEVIAIYKDVTDE